MYLLDDLILINDELNSVSDVMFSFQIAPCLQPGSGWWVAGVLAPSSPSWWLSSGRVRSRVGRRGPSGRTPARRNPNMTSPSPASTVRFQAPPVCGITALNLMLWCCFCVTRVRALNVKDAVKEKTCNLSLKSLASAKTIKKWVKLRNYTEF